MKKFTSILLSLLMLISMTATAVTNVSAVEGDVYESTASENDLYESTASGDEVHKSSSSAISYISTDYFTKTFVAGNSAELEYYLEDIRLSVYVYYSSGEKEEYDYYFDEEFFRDSVEYSGDCITKDEDGRYYCTPKQGENVITISYCGKTAEFLFYASTVDSIEVTSYPSDTYIYDVSYFIPDELYGLALTVNFSDGTSEVHYGNEDSRFFSNEVTFLGACVEENNQYMTLAPGENAVQILCGGKTADIIFTAVGVTSIEVTSAPRRTNFIVGNEYDVKGYLKGIEVTAYFSDGTSEVYTYKEDEDFIKNHLKYSGDCIDEKGYIMTPVLGENVITVSLCGKTADYVINGVEVSSIFITKYPSTGTFIAGRNYDFRSCIYGMELAVDYTNGTRDVFQQKEDSSFFLYEIQYSGDCIDKESGDLVLSPGRNIITLSLSGKTTKLAVNALGVENIEITQKTDKPDIIAGVNYAINNFIDSVKVYFSNGSSEEYKSGYDLSFFEYDISYSGACVGNEGKYMTPSAGENVITAHVYGQTAEVSFFAYEVDSITVTESSDNVHLISGSKYAIEDYIDKVSLSYSDGTIKEFNPVDDKEFFKYNIKYSGECVDSEDNDIMYPQYGENVITVICGGKTDQITYNGVEVSGIEVVTPPDKTEFVVGLKYYFNDIIYGSGMQIKLKYSDGTSSISLIDDLVGFPNIRFSGENVVSEENKLSYFTPKEGVNRITITCYGKSAEFELTAIKVTSIEMTKQPDEQEYVAGQSYDLSLCILSADFEITYSNGTTKWVSGDEFYYSHHFEYSGENVADGKITPVAGDNLITITYLGKSTNFVMTAFAMVTGIEVIKQPEPYDFIAGVDYYIDDCIASAKFKVSYSDGTSKTYSGSNCSGMQFTGGSVYGGKITPVPGNNIITATYAGKSADITITAKEALSVECSLRSSKSIFIEGIEYGISYLIDELDFTVNFTDGTSHTFTKDNDRDRRLLYSLNYTGSCISTDEYGDVSFTPTRGENTIVVNCVGKTDDITFTALKVAGIEITSAPKNTTFITENDYYISNYLDGMAIKLNFSDNTSQVFAYEDNMDFFTNQLKFSGDYIDGYGRRLTPVLGENVITVGICGKTAQYTVYGINSDSVSKIEVTKAPDKVNYYVGYSDWFSSDGIEITAYLNDGKSYIIGKGLACNRVYYSSDCFDPYFNKVENISYGENTVLVVACGLSDKFSIYGVETPVEKIELVQKPGSKLTAPFSGDMITDMVLRVYFKDKTVTDVDFSQNCQFTYTYISDSIYKGLVYLNNDVLKKYSGSTQDVCVEFTIKEGAVTFNIFGKEFTYTEGKLTGDANGDGVVSILDVSVIQMYIAKLASSNVDVSACDVDGDGEVNISDASYLQMIMAKLV